MEDVRIEERDPAQEAMLAVHRLAQECLWKPSHRGHKNDPALKKHGRRMDRAPWHSVYREAFTRATVASQLKAGADPVLEVLHFAWDYLWLPGDSDRYGLTKTDLRAETTLNARVAVALGVLEPTERAHVFRSLTGGGWAGHRLDSLCWGKTPLGVGEPEGAYFEDGDRPTLLSYEMKIKSPYKAEQFVLYVNFHHHVVERLAPSVPANHEHLLFSDKKTRWNFLEPANWASSETSGYRACTPDINRLEPHKYGPQGWEVLAAEIRISTYSYEDLLRAFDDCGFDPANWRHAAARLQLLRTVRYAQDLSQRPSWPGASDPWMPSLR